MGFATIGQERPSNPPAARQHDTLATYCVREVSGETQRNQLRPRSSIFAEQTGEFSAGHPDQADRNALPLAVVAGQQIRYINHCNGSRSSRDCGPFPLPEIGADACGDDYAKSGSN
jgi:hypothetical protein